MIDSWIFRRTGVHWRARCGIFFAVLVTAVLSASPTAAQGPVAYYPFNGSSDDSSGFGNHCVNHGAVPTADRAGNTSAAYLVGDNAYLEAPDAPPLDVSQELSICAWIRHDFVETIMAIFVGKGANSAYSLGLYYDGSWACPDPSAFRRPQVSVGGASTRFSEAPEIECGLGEWHHIVVTVTTEADDSHIATYYLDGVFEDTQDLLGSFGDNSLPLGIGLDGEGQYRFVGAIDDVRVYDRVLSSAEVSELYNALLIDGFESGSGSAWSAVTGG